MGLRLISGGPGTCPSILGVELGRILKTKHPLVFMVVCPPSRLGLGIAFKDQVPCRYLWLSIHPVGKT